ncbi:MAG: hypothetical protein ACHQC8_06660 [Solirubrobacterales bacterium]
MSRLTKKELEDELETMRTKLEEAHGLISEALGYEDESQSVTDDEDAEDAENEQ